MNRENSKIKVKSIVENFNLKIISNKNRLDNEIRFSSISRVGLELAGTILYSKIWSIIYLGSKESKYLNSLSKKKMFEALERVLGTKPPLILLGKNFLLIDEVKQVADKYKKTPIALTDFNFTDFNFTITIHLIEKMLKYNIHHGSLVQVYGIGVLIIGESGVGKSEISMELVKQGHIFIADDAVEIARVGNSLIGKSCELTKGFIEIRGLGIINFQKAFGYHKIIDSTEIKVVIELVIVEKIEETSFERIGLVNTIKIDDIDVVYYKIPILAGRRTSNLIEGAITDYKIKSTGYVTKDDLEKRIMLRKGKKC